ncbi:MAG: hypothetical protein AMS20_15220 [Gemmatimonas sp. SG8_28]|nr:MAG: hypothetical protein AMS20_15220 [Gemmatimonas sp. SG8_28]
MIGTSLRAACGLALFSLGIAGCGGSGGGQQEVSNLAPVRLNIPRSELPSPGLCRIVGSGLARSCNDIEFAAEPGETIVFRPRDDSRRIVVCYMHRSNRNQIEGIDVFNMDTRDLIEVIQRRGDPPPPGGCQGALDS